MERESLLTVLIILLGGAALQAFTLLPLTGRDAASAIQRERIRWARLWQPAIAVLLIAAWLCGWALAEPDPVPDRVHTFIFVACAPFAFLLIRAVLRAVWALSGNPHDAGLATIGFIRPRVVVSAELANSLDERALRAALEHERAHARHRDPMRIWLAQMITDLQWPSSKAHRRFEAWLAALEQSRDDEARAAGADGADIAAAVLSSLRFHRGQSGGSRARLTGDGSELRDRIARLLKPLPEAPPDTRRSVRQTALLLMPCVLAAVACGVLFGARIVDALLAIRF